MAKKSEPKCVFDLWRDFETAANEVVHTAVDYRDKIQKSIETLNAARLALGQEMNRLVAEKNKP